MASRVSASSNTLGDILNWLDRVTVSSTAKENRHRLIIRFRAAKQRSKFKVYGLLARSRSETKLPPSFHEATEVKQKDRENRKVVKVGISTYLNHLLANRYERAFHEVFGKQTVNGNGKQVNKVVWLRGHCCASDGSVSLDDGRQVDPVGKTIDAINRLRNTYVLDPVIVYDFCYASTLVDKLERSIPDLCTVIVYPVGEEPLEGISRYVVAMAGTDADRTVAELQCMLWSVSCVRQSWSRSWYGKQQFAVAVERFCLGHAWSVAVSILDISTCSCNTVYTEGTKGLSFLVRSRFGQ